ncbi:MAG TPA: condensation domain-containing protein, partial [Pyrinomonadaceae bacterium]
MRPLSGGQQSLWFTHQLAPQESTYNLAYAARIRSGLDVDCLRLAFQELTDRHESLRTTFEAGDGGPVRRVHEHAAVYFQEEDAAGLDEARLQERVAAEARRPFDLERGPLLKVHLFARPAGEYVLLLTAHHIVLDFWSLAVLTQELGVLYGARRSGALAELPPLARVYSDYVRWQEELARSEEGELHRAYWQRELSGQLPVLELPTDRPRPPVQTYRGATHSFGLGPELTRRLRAFSRGQRVTLYTTLLAAFQLLLHRYTGQEDILVGSPTSGRSRGWMAGLVGYLVNPVVMRARLSGEQTFEEFLSQTRRAVFAAFEHQDYPFALLVQSLQPERDASRSPLFQVMFTLQKSHLPDGQALAALGVGDEGARIPLGDVVLEPMPLPQRAAHFDLMLVLVETGERLVASLEYNTDLFDATTIERMSRHFGALLEGVVADPGARLGDLPILPEDERRQLLFGWNETRRDYPADATVHELFERQARLTPHAPALVFESERVTYAELDERADRLAARLRRGGVGAESRVGVLLERSTELVVGLLGVLKAGGAYVPLDPEYPAERLRFMAEDAGLSLVLTGGKLSGLAAALAQGAGAAVVRVDDIGEEDAGEEAARAHGAAVSPGNLAYVIYTSGSTGRPKGVALTHSGAAVFLRWARDAFDDRQLSGVLASTSVSFDLSVFEVFAPLC